MVFRMRFDHGRDDMLPKRDPILRQADARTSRIADDSIMSVAERAENVRRAIEFAFAATRPPDPRYLCATPYDEGVTEYFAGQPWRGHKVADLRYHEVALSFLAANALRYYLPAFLLATLDDRTVADVIPDVIWWKFRDREDFSRLYGMPPTELFDKRERNGLAVFFSYESDLRAEHWDRPLYRGSDFYGLNELATLETETLTILKNIGRRVDPNELSARRNRARLAELFGFTIEGH